MREHLKQVEKSLGHAPEELAYEELSLDLIHIWEMYFDIRNAQKSGEPINFSELKAYCDLTETHLSGFELRCLLNLDRAFIGVSRG